MTSTYFSLTPELEFSGIIDIQAPTWWKIYKAAIDTLSSSEKYDGEARGLYEVLKEYLERGDDNGWTDAVSGINMIPNDVQDPSTEYNNPATH